VTVLVIVLPGSVETCVMICPERVLVIVTVGPGWMSWMMITWTEVIDAEEDELEELDEGLPEPPAAEPEEPPEDAPDPESDDEEELDDEDELEDPDPDPEPGAGAGGAGAGAVPTEGEVDCGGASGSVAVVLIPLMFSVMVATEVTTEGGLLAGATELATPPAVTVIVDFSVIVSFSVAVTVA
jgi:hypothetical protein